MSELPHAEESVRVTPLGKDSIAPFEELQLTQTTTWAALAETHTLFTPAMLYLGVPLEIDPFSAYQQETGIELRPQSLLSVTGHPLFLGLCNPQYQQTWNYQILCAPKEAMQPFHEWLILAKYLDSGRQVIYWPRLSRLLVRDDPAFSRRPDEVPRVEITAWELDTSRGRLYIAPVPSDPRCVARAHYDPQDLNPKLVAWQQAWLAGQSNPHVQE